jgi:hypothetical protein
MKTILLTMSVTYFLLGSLIEYSNSSRILLSVIIFLFGIVKIVTAILAYL